jgi:glycosyltransferase involved in cell wall biosynthesis
MWWVSSDAFDRQMADLQAYDVVPLSEYDPSNRRHACITFDGIYENVYQYAFPILKKWGYPFELFVIGDHIGGDNAFDTVEPLTPFCTLEQLLEMAEGGARIQWHTRSHQRLKNASDETLDDELLVPPGLREMFSAPHFDWFAYPHGDHDDRAVERVKEHYVGALSCIAGSDGDRYQLNRITVEESTKLSSSSVTVIIANYNYGPFMPEAVASVLAQTRQPDEIIILDDCSNDGSQKIARRYADKARVVLNEKNLGIVENFRKGVSLANSDYIVFLGADNRMRPDYIERCKAILDANPEAGVVYTDMLIFGERAAALAETVGAELVGDSKAERWPLYAWRFPDPTPEAVAGLAIRNFIHGSSMYRRCAYDQVGGYRASELPEDHHLFHRMVVAGWKPMRCAHTVLQYRQHSYKQANSVLSLQNEVSYWRTQFYSNAEKLAAFEREAEERALNGDVMDAEFKRLVQAVSKVQLIVSSQMLDVQRYAAEFDLPLDDVDQVVWHYLLCGEPQGIAPSEKFDPAYYSTTYRDVASAGLSPLLHYLTWGRFEGRLARPAAPDIALPQGGPAALG